MEVKGLTAPAMSGRDPYSDMPERHKKCSTNTFTDVLSYTQRKWTPHLSHKINYQETRLVCTQYIQKYATFCVKRR